MKTMVIKAVIIADHEGNYIIHGSSTETPSEMFKTLAPLWHFDPSKEQACYVEIPAEMNMSDDDIQPS